MIVMSKLRVLLFSMALLTVLFIAGVQAQEPATFSMLTIDVWPEYDRPEALVIVQGSAAPDLAYPVQLTFDLPAEVTDMHAVAVRSADGNLMNNDYQLTPVDGGQQLSFVVNQPSFVFEYYDPGILQQDGQTRDLRVDYLNNHNVDVLQVQVQTPLNAESVTFDGLQPDNTFTGTDQLTYHIFRRDNAVPGDEIVIRGRYQKSSDELTVQPADSQPIPQAATTPPLSQPTTTNPDWTIWLGAGMVGLGVLALVGAIGFWFFNRQNTDVEPRRPQRKKSVARTSRPTAPRRPAREEVALTSKFCTQCGAEFKSDAQFCHQCGEARR